MIVEEVLSPVEGDRVCAGPLGAGPLGAGPLGAGPLGAGPLGAGPLGAGPWGADPLGAVGWDFYGDPLARPVEPPAVDASVFEAFDVLGEGDPEAEFLWEAALAPAAIMARARAERADGLVAELERIDAAQARLEARKAIALAALTAAVGGSSEDPARRLDAPTVAASELAAALRISQRTASAAVAEALAVTKAPWAPVLAGMCSGALPRRRAAAILDAAAPVPPERLDEFAAEAAAIANPPDPEGIPTQGALRRRLRRLAEKHAGEPLEVRKERAAAHRRVDLEPDHDGMCWLSAYLPLEAGAAIDTRLEAIARSLQGPGEERTLGQLRADALADLLAGTESSPLGGVRTELIVTVPARTLTGGADAPGQDGAGQDGAGQDARGEDAPGEIVGYGPIDAGAVRLLAAEAATWSRLCVEPGTGAPLALGRRRYTPTPAMRRFLGARDRTCRFPGCDKPAAAAEADHTREWSDGGATDTGNLALLCPQHHRLKTLGHWEVRQAGTAPADPATTRVPDAPADPAPPDVPGTPSARTASRGASPPPGTREPPGTLE
ncbi:DUF222 domain-containing protein [Sinomonas sp. JGH33]|uniref:DUF222 domain-containing protein n=1 Tax=Sinomonas terricola TaxID=3110330 RepID=A0ABU5T3G4_9MICC|nr:DUF222 domain-containing protein [Sinomonas sp. JGH33]MEA5454204.1 DUF222 domain-containing protein [Sinomonas sp. JGH33]